MVSQAWPVDLRCGLVIREVKKKSTVGSKGQKGNPINVGKVENNTLSQVKAFDKVKGKKINI